MNPSDAFMQNREAIARIPKSYGPENVRVFGSLIRGEDQEDGDLDFLAGGNSHQCFQAEIALERFLNVRVNVIARDSLYKPFEVCTLADAVPLLDAFPGARPSRGEMFVRAKDIFRLKWILQGLDRIRTSTKNKTEHVEDHFLSVARRGEDHLSDQLSLLPDSSGDLAWGQISSFWK